MICQESSSAESKGSKETCGGEREKPRRLLTSWSGMPVFQPSPGIHAIAHVA